jgi:hypothetical protein
VNHKFERRLALFPAVFDEEGILYANTGFGDYPLIIPDQKISEPGELFPGWMLLSYDKPVRVSDAMEGQPGENAVDEEIRTAWNAKSGSGGEWISVDLEKEYNICALQVNFADVNGTMLTGDDGCHYQFRVEYSHDGESWKMLDDQSAARNNSPHYYLQLEQPVRSRFVKITNDYFPGGHFSISGFRIFGTGEYDKPGEPGQMTIMRDSTDRTTAQLSWSASPVATGYNVRYGTDRERLYHQHLVYGDTTLILRSLEADARYYFALDAFNENGISRSGSIHVLE